MKKNKLLVLLLIFLPTLFAEAQNSTPVEMWSKISPELQINFKNSPFEIRFRPDEHTFTSPKYFPDGHRARIDLMLGVKIWKFKIFSYTKNGLPDYYWTGLRLDFDTKALNDKLLINLQGRYFWGLNKKSVTHYYLVQYIRYKINEVNTLGIMGIGRFPITTDFDKGHWFIGPSASFSYSKALSFTLSLQKDIFYEKLYCTYVGLKYTLDFN